jgi:hypothetical protein
VLAEVDAVTSADLLTQLHSILKRCFIEVRSLAHPLHSIREQRICKACIFFSLCYQQSHVDSPPHLCQTLCYGNLHRQDALGLSVQLCELVHTAAMHPCEWPNRRVLCLSRYLPHWAVGETPAPLWSRSEGEGSAVSVALYPTNPDTANPNSAVQLSAQVRNCCLSTAHHCFCHANRHEPYLHY